MKVSELTLFSDMATKNIEPLTIEDEQNPRVRIWNHGGDCLSNAELLALIIGKGVGSLSSLDIAMSIMDECHNRWGELARMQPYDLYRHLGVGYAKAAKILAAVEIAKRLQSEKAEVYARMDSASHIYEYMKPRMAYRTTECCYALLLSNSFKLIKAVKVSEGGLTEAAIDIRVVGREALLANATAVALTHNHPSGTLRPSRQDDELTKRMKEGLATLRLYFLDHVIVTEGGYYSYSEEGRI